MSTPQTLAPPQTGMMTLPPEVIIKVCKCITQVGALKRIRCVSRLFHDIVTKLVFENLLVYPHPDSWEKVNLIAETPDISAFVRKLQVVRQPPLPNYKREKHYKIGTRRFRADIERHGSLDVFNVGGADHQSLGGVERERLLRIGYERHCFWVEGQDQVSEWHHLYASNPQTVPAAIPRIALEKLPHLSTIQSIGKKELVEQLDPQYGDKYPGYTRHELETFISFDDLHTMSDVPDQNLELIMLAAERSHKIIPNWQLRSLGQLLKYPKPRKVFGLRTLVLNLQGFVNYDPRTFMKRAHWNITFASLEELTILQDPDKLRNVDVAMVLWASHINMPALKQLKLINVTATCNSLQPFFSRIQWPLQSLTIEALSMAPSEWVKAKTMVLDSDCVQPKGAMEIIMTDSFRPDVINVEQWYANKDVIF